MKLKKETNKKKRIKAIIFDVNGVLQLEKYPPSILKREHLGVHEYMAKKFKLDLDSWFDSIDTFYSESIEGKIDGKKAVKIISKNLATDPRKIEKLFIKTYKKFFKKNKELYKTAYALKKKDYLVGVLSDQWHLSKKALITKDIKKFEIVIISCDVGIRKPDLRIYKLLIKKIKEKNRKIKTSEILFVDNREWNLKPANKLGMKTILFKDNKKLFRKFKKLGVL
ncbi:MAG: HAD-IA family hydrolase [Nanoarchaeota archaeon]